MGLNLLVCINDIVNEELTQQVGIVEVNEKIDQNTSFKLKFPLDINDQDISKSLLEETLPGKILSVLTKVNGDLLCLTKGPITIQEINLLHGGAGSWIQVLGEDTGHLMDKVTHFHVSDGVSDADIVFELIQRYEQMIPDVEETPESTHQEENHSFIQRDTDLSVIRNLARRNGYHFWITYSVSGEGTCHFKSRSLEGAAVADLIVNLDNYNIDALYIIADFRRPTRTVGKQLDLRTKKTMGETVNLNDHILGSEGLATIAGSNTHQMHLAPTVDDSGAMQTRGRAALREAQWFIRARCRISLHRLFKVIQIHTLLYIQGAGTR